MFARSVNFLIFTFLSHHYFFFIVIGVNQARGHPMERVTFIEDINKMVQSVCPNPLSMIQKRQVIFIFLQFLIFVVKVNLLIFIDYPEEKIERKESRICLRKHLQFIQWLWFILIFLLFNEKLRCMVGLAALQSRRRTPYF
jgi:hypothetical protein